MISIADITSNLYNIPGWSSRRKIVVFESDDWGSIRMPSDKALDKLNAAGLDLVAGDASRYNHFDTLESATDLEALGQLLLKYKGADGNPPSFTLVSLVANPDFEAIKANKFEQYVYEPFTVTLERYGHLGVMDMLKQGVQNGIFSVQFHGREHLNVAFWMRALQAGDTEARLAFEEGCWGFNNRHPHQVTFQAAFDLDRQEDLELQHSIIRDGLKLFRQIHGSPATFFVPPNGPYNDQLSSTAAEGGIRYLSLSKKHYNVWGNGRKKLQINWLGKKNRYQQTILTRNCVFEPGMDPGSCVERCLHQLETSFRWNKPAVISTHRVNFIGSRHEENRKNGLIHLDSLLKQITKRWPEVIFLSSDQLGVQIQGSHS